MAKVAVLAATPAGKVHREAVFMEDINHTGAGLRTRFPLPVGFPLLLEIKNQVRGATVRRCSQEGAADYFVGIEFDEPADDVFVGRMQRAHGFAFL
jgi:hypothetical protein